MTARRFSERAASPLAGVPADAWRSLVAALDVQPISAVSTSGGLGSYDVRPRRLVEIGYAVNLRSSRTGAGRQIYVCDFVLPWTQRRFLADPVAQYVVLTRSSSLYYEAMRSGELQRPDGVSLSGALAILHVGGRGALKGWPDLFSDTRARFEAAQGLF